jgi:hypothetical protein
VNAARFLETLGRPPSEPELRVRYYLALGRPEALSGNPPDAVSRIEALLEWSEPRSVVVAAADALVALRASSSTPALASFLGKIPPKGMGHSGPDWRPLSRFIVGAIAQIAAADDTIAIAAVSAEDWGDESIRRSLATMLREPELAEMMRVVSMPLSTSPEPLPAATAAPLERLRARGADLVPVSAIVDRIDRYSGKVDGLSLAGRGLRRCKQCGATTRGVQRLIDEVFGADEHGELRCARTFEVSCGECGEHIETWESDHAADQA